MILTIKIPDELMEYYNAMDPLDPKKAITSVLERFKDYSPKNRAVIIPESARGALERVYGKPLDLNEIPRFVEWAIRNASLGLGETVLPLTNAQRRAIADQAVKYGKKPGEHFVELLKDFVRREYGE